MSNITPDNQKNSYWDLKPIWCQPWTILLTGFVCITCSWFIFHIRFLTLIIFILVSIWWYLFLYLAPSIYSKSLDDV